MARVVNGSHSFTVIHAFILEMNEAYLPLPSQLSWSLFTHPRGMEC